MADYGYGAGYGTGLGHGITHGADALAHGITLSIAQSKKERDTAEAVQGLLDVARRMQYPDQKSGKVTNFFKDDQLQYIQRLIDQKKYKAAGAAEAAMGIGKDMYGRIQTAAAKQADAYQKQQELARMQQQSAGGPYQMTDAQGNKYRGNLNDKGVVQWYPDTSVPKNQMGLSAKDQIQLQQSQGKNMQKAQMDQFKAQQSAQKAQVSTFHGLLNGLGIKSPTDLFDPTIQQGGFFSPSGGFVNSKVPTTAQTDSTKGPFMDKISDVAPGSDVSNFQENPQFQQDATHIRFYHKEPGKDPSDKGQQGLVLPTSDVVNLQNVAAGIAGPQALQALQWLRQNPTNENADAVREEIIKRTGEAAKAPDPVTYDLTPPSFAPPSAPAQPYGQQQQPTDDSQVSDEAAAQNPGY